MKLNPIHTYLFVYAKVHNDIDKDPEKGHEDDWVDQHPLECPQHDGGGVAPGNLSPGMR